MSTEQHEALKLAEILEANARSGTVTDSDDERKTAAMLRASHALIVQMAEALEENDDYLTGPTAWSDEQWDALVETTHAAKTAAKDYLK